jgi:hypothetical protein
MLTIFIIVWIFYFSEINKWGKLRVCASDENKVEVIYEKHSQKVETNENRAHSLGRQNEIRRLASSEDHCLCGAWFPADDVVGVAIALALDKADGNTHCDHVSSGSSLACRS